MHDPLCNAETLTEKGIAVDKPKVVEPVEQVSVAPKTEVVEDESDDNLGMIIGISVGGFVLLVLVTLALCCIRKKAKNKTKIDHGIIAPDSKTKISPI